MMSKVYFEWDKDFETGNKLIDGQHYSLVELINELIKVDLNKDSGALKKIEDINQQLSNYIVEHLLSEENLMEKYSVDERHVKAHKMMHQEFIDKVKQNCSDTIWFSDKEKMANIIEYLIRWLAYHILNEDKSLFRQIEYIEKSGYTPIEAYDKDVQIIECATEPLLKALKALYYLVSEKNKELEFKNIELEETVKTRTKELIKANEKLEEISLIDELTGLHNRRFFMTEINQLMYNWERYQEPFSLIYLDADKFKSVNDNFGHEKGDIVLKWISQFLKANIRKSNIACRLGGDEFVVICGHCTIHDAIDIGENLVKEYKKEMNGEISEFWRPSFSIGIAAVDNTIKSAEDLLKKSDSAMYISKKNGGGQLSISNEHS